MMGTVRITAGAYKNARLAVPAGAHPMGERERTAIFNSLGDSVRGARVLDAFAGSGALGLEALSRGAMAVDFLEKSPAALLRNIRGLGVQEAAKVVKTLAGPYDVIFADPPYDRPQLAEVSEVLERLAVGGVAVVSLPREMGLPDFPGLLLSADRTYARARILYYRKAGR